VFFVRCRSPCKGVFTVILSVVEGYLSSAFSRQNPHGGGNFEQESALKLSFDFAQDDRERAGDGEVDTA